MQIGEVASRTGLSLRSIRYYEEVGLVIPSARSAGGFRLYTEPDLERLRLIMRMKPLDFTLEEMGDLLAVVDALPSARGAAREELVRRLRGHQDTVTTRVEKLRGRLRSAEEFADQLAREVGPS